MTRNPEFTQVVVWPGTIVGVDMAAVFEANILEHMNTRVQYLEEIKTTPDMDNGYPVKGTGGRNDVFFAVHSEDISKFAIPRLQFGMHWIEDVLDNEVDRGDSIYPQRVIEYRTW